MEQPTSLDEYLFRFNSPDNRKINPGTFFPTEKKGERLDLSIDITPGSLFFSKTAHLSLRDRGMLRIGCTKGLNSVARESLELSLAELDLKEDSSIIRARNSAYRGSSETLGLLLEGIDDPKTKDLLKIINYLVKSQSLVLMLNEFRDKFSTNISRTTNLRDVESFSRVTGEAFEPIELWIKAQINDNLGAATILMSRVFKDEFEKYEEEFVAKI